MLKYDVNGLIPAVVQDTTTRQVLMLGYMNRESVQRTVETGQAWFWSRSRSELWHKGATSGHYLNVRALRVDCDGDTLLVEAEPAGPTCHTGAVSCFFNELEAADVRPAGEPVATSSGPDAAHAAVPRRERHGAGRAHGGGAVRGDSGAAAVAPGRLVRGQAARCGRGPHREEDRRGGHRRW